MTIKQHPPWSCYPGGLESSRRTFLKALAAATTSAWAFQTDATGMQQETGTDVAPDIPGDYPEGAVRLNFNENPLGPSPKAIAAIVDHGLASANYYNNISPLSGTLARHHQVSEQQILVGCGSTEFLHIAPWTFLDEEGALVTPEPSYGWSSGIAEAMGRRVVRVALDPEGRVDTGTLRKAFDRNTRLVYLANPNNPTGASLAVEEVGALAEALPDGAVLLVDEAYAPFLPSGRTAMELVRGGAPVLVTRTFSKAHGLAGLRLGYAVAPEAIIEKLKTFWFWDLGINAAVLVAAPAALTDDDHVTRYVDTVDQGLETLRAGLAELGVRTLPHRAPFLMADLGREAGPIVQSLKSRTIYVRDGKAWKMPTYVRLSIGTRPDNLRFLDALRQVL